MRTPTRSSDLWKGKIKNVLKLHALISKKRNTDSCSRSKRKHDGVLGCLKDFLHLKFLLQFLGRFSPSGGCDRVDE